MDRGSFKSPINSRRGRVCAREPKRRRRRRERESELNSRARFYPGYCANYLRVNVGVEKSRLRGVDSRRQVNYFRVVAQEPTLSFRTIRWVGEVGSRGVWERGEVVLLFKEYDVGCYCWYEICRW